MIASWLTKKVADVPAAGTGIHAHLFSCARQLHAHLDSESIEAMLTIATANAQRRVTPREIRDAVQNSRAVAWAPGETRNKTGIIPTRSVTRERAASGDWPKPDPIARYFRIAETAQEISCLHDLWEWSPSLPRWSADDWLDWLFPDAEWLCLAQEHPATARSRRREKWSFGPADECSFIVPSPMTGPSGKTLDGRTSHRCLGNTGPRRWLVIEFDSGSIDEQAVIHWHLRAAARASSWPPLRLCVHSGGKSLHGWYGPVVNEENAFELMWYAASLGADTASWNRSQLMRLPGGIRTVKLDAGIPISLPDWAQPSERVRQEVMYFEPNSRAAADLSPAG